MNGSTRASTKVIHYRDGYKYQLAETYTVDTGIEPPVSISTQFIGMEADGKITILSGYAWDGPSGPVSDRPSTMRASLVHDALYQLMRLEFLPTSIREKADSLFASMCIEDGVWRVTAYTYYVGLRIFGRLAADPKFTKKVRTAP